MRIAMISTPFVSVPPKDYGGTELVVHELTEGLIERGHHVTLFAPGDSVTSAELIALFPRAQWPPEALTELDHISLAFQAIANGGFDVVHAHSAVALALARLVPRLPLVYTLHHERDERLSSFYRSFSDVWYIAISDDQRRREIPLRLTQVIHHGVDVRRYAWTDAPGDYVAFIGRLSPIKGPHTAIDAAGRAGVAIHVAGDVHPVDREFGEREMRRRLDLPHVRYLGAIGMAAKVLLLRDARALLTPVEWNEPFGLAIVEAMLSGCPVVGFAHGSLPELIEPGVTGFLAATEAEMVELLRPGGVLDRFDRRRCHECAVLRFGRDRMVADHERYYWRAISASRAGRRRMAAD